MTFPQALDAIDQMVAAGSGGYVVTPNVDHVVLAETRSDLQRAYEDASLSLVDGMPLVWLSRALGHALPGKVSGSDLMVPLLQRAADKHWRVFFSGGEPGVGEEAAQCLRQSMPGLQVVGTDSPPYGFDKDPLMERRALSAIRDAEPQLVLLALGCPKQELLMHRWYQELSPAVLLGIGASLDFVAGHVRRAPAWMSQVGLEWVYRMTQDPRRLAYRYLVRDRAFVPIAVRMFRTPKADRAYSG